MLMETLFGNYTWPKPIVLKYTVVMHFILKIIYNLLVKVVVSG